MILYKIKIDTEDAKNKVTVSSMTGISSSIDFAVREYFITLNGRASDIEPEVEELVNIHEDGEFYDAFDEFLSAHPEITNLREVVQLRFLWQLEEELYKLGVDDEDFFTSALSIQRDNIGEMSEFELAPVSYLERKGINTKDIKSIFLVPTRASIRRHPDFGVEFEDFKALTSMPELIHAYPMAQYVLEVISNSDLANSEVRDQIATIFRRMVSVQPTNLYYYNQDKNGTHLCVAVPDMVTEFNDSTDFYRTIIKRAPWKKKSETAFSQFLFRLISNSEMSEVVVGLGAVLPSFTRKGSQIAEMMENQASRFSSNDDSTLERTRIVTGHPTTIAAMQVKAESLIEEENLSKSVAVWGLGSIGGAYLKYLHEDGKYSPIGLEINVDRALSRISGIISEEFSGDIRTIVDSFVSGKDASYETDYFILEKDSGVVRFIDKKTKSEVWLPAFEHDKNGKKTIDVYGFTSKSLKACANRGSVVANTSTANNPRILLEIANDPELDFYMIDDGEPKILENLYNLLEHFKRNQHLIDKQVYSYLVGRIDQYLESFRIQKSNGGFSIGSVNIFPVVVEVKGKIHRKTAFKTPGRVCYGVSNLDNRLKDGGIVHHRFGCEDETVEGHKSLVRKLSEVGSGIKIRPNDVRAAINTISQS